MTIANFSSLNFLPYKMRWLTNYNWDHKSKSQLTFESIIIKLLFLCISFSINMMTKGIDLLVNYIKSLSPTTLTNEEIVGFKIAIQ